MRAQLRSSCVTLGQEQVLRLVKQGYPTRQIANRLGISETAVQSRIRRIYSKLGVRDRLELTLYAICHRL